MATTTISSINVNPRRGLHSFLFFYERNLEICLFMVKAIDDEDQRLLLLFSMPEVNLCTYLHSILDINCHYCGICCKKRGDDTPAEIIESGCIEDIYFLVLEYDNQLVIISILCLGPCIFLPLQH